MGRFQRKARNREQRQRFLIVLEGAVTEQEYFNSVRRLLRVSSADLELIPPGPTSPREIVERARELQRRARRDDAYDQVWCVFDVEAKIAQRARPGIPEAIELAKHSGISLAVSNPCFELWILLHFEDCHAWVGSEAVQVRCSAQKCVDGKHLTATDQLLALYGAARSRALGLEAMHDRNLIEKLIDRNPSTAVYSLVDAIFSAFGPHP